MCVVSMVGDHYRDKWVARPYFPTIIQPNIIPNLPNLPKTGKAKGSGVLPPVPISREEFDQLRKEVLELKELLIRAKKYDEDNNEPHCEIEEKMEILRKMAAIVGINLDDVIGKSGE